MNISFFLCLGGHHEIIGQATGFEAKVRNDNSQFHNGNSATTTRGCRGSDGASAGGTC